MLLDLNALSAASEEVPIEWRAFLQRTDGGVVVRGDRVGGTEIYLARDARVVSDRLDELLTHLADRGREPQLSAFGISALLHHGLVPPPHSEFAGIDGLTIGDRVTIRGDGAIAATWEYPWFPANSRNDNTPDEAHLLELLTAATERQVRDAGGGFLMLSSGKDSAAVALALAEAGRSDVFCVTYSSGPEDPEPAVAAEICKRLGLEHRVFQLENDPAAIATALTAFFRSSPAVGADLAQIPYVLATAAAGSPGGVVLDGGGNDSYMGFPVTGRWTAKTRLRIRGRKLVDLVQRHSPVDSPLNYLARTRLETAISGRMMRVHESRTFFPGAVDTRHYWQERDRETADLDLFDAYAVLERFITPPSSQKKHNLAARAAGHEPGVPWCGPDIADYYFNLPEEHRYDRKTGTNKLLLRSMLLRYLDYDAAEVGKHYFAFDGARFVAENEAFIRTEIDACPMWDRTGLGLVHGWIDQIEQRPKLYHPILTVFMVSGWRNHSRFVTDGAVVAAGANDE
ncbi:MAG: asparagine synthase-related protein [Acidimicrobiia bacterium]|nr:asparagine synthase-related protein [Acidimicrobiia bacterium]